MRKAHNCHKEGFTWHVLHATFISPGYSPRQAVPLSAVPECLSAPRDAQCLPSPHRALLPGLCHPPQKKKNPSALAPAPACAVSGGRRDGQRGAPGGCRGAPNRDRAASHLPARGCPYLCVLIQQESGGKQLGVPSGAPGRVNRRESVGLGGESGGRAGKRGRIRGKGEERLDEVAHHQPPQPWQCLPVAPRRRRTPEGC